MHRVVVRIARERCQTKFSRFRLSWIILLLSPCCAHRHITTADRYFDVTNNARHKKGRCIKKSHAHLPGFGVFHLSAAPEKICIQWSKKVTLGLTRWPRKPERRWHDALLSTVSILSACCAPGFLFPLVVDFHCCSVRWQISLAGCFCLNTHRAAIRRCSTPGTTTTAIPSRILAGGVGTHC